MAELLDRPIHQAAFARRLARLSSKHRRELEALAGIPPDPAKVPAEFWDKVRRETADELAVVLVLIWMMSANQHGMSRGRADLLGEQYARLRASEVASIYVSNSQQMLSGLSDRYTPASTKSDVRQGLSTIFGPNRAERIARTETTHARSDGIATTADGEEGVIDENGDRILNPVLVWELEVLRDVKTHCTFCPLVAGTARDVWSRFLAGGPPAHTLCACGILVLPEGSKTRNPVSDSAISIAASDSGVFGF